MNDFQPPSSPNLMPATGSDLAGQELTREELERFFNLIPDMACIASADGYFKKVNRAWQRVLGYTEQEILATPFLDFIHPDDRDATKKEVERQLAGEATMQFCNRYRCKDGGYKWLEWDATPAVCGTRLFATARDISERKKAEESLHASEARLQEIIDMMPVALFVKDSTSNIILMNRACEEQWGMSFSDLRGTDAGRFFPPEQMALFLAKDKEVFASRQSVDFEEAVWNATLGENRIVHTYKKPVFDAVGNPLFLIGATVDITERKRAKKLLSDSERKYRTLVELAGDAIFLADTVSGTILDCNINATKLTGRSKSEIIGLNQSELHPPDKAPLYKKIFRDHIESGGAIGENLLVAHLDGRTIPVDIHATVFELDGVRVILGIFRDITERKAAEQQLRDLAAHILDVREDEKCRIAREVHDELGGTLVALSIDTYWLSRKLSTYDNASALVERLKSMSQRIDGAVNTTRRIVDDMRPAVLDDLGLLAAIEWLAEDFHTRTGIECRVRCIEDEANLDKQRSTALFRILQEALTNILKHSGASKVEIEFFHSENLVKLSVGDNGCGISGTRRAVAISSDLKSYGMLGMTERIAQFGGRIVFGSPTEGGLHIDLVLPLPAGEGGAQ